MGFRPKVWMYALALALIGAGALALLWRTRAEAPVVPEAPVESPRREVIGQSVEGRDIEAFTYGDGGTRLLFVGGVHGGYEWNSVLLAYAVMDYLSANPAAIAENVSVTIVPDANPDGVFKVIGKEGRFTLADVPADEGPTGNGRLNANAVDLNRNFDCHWQAKSMWRGNEVSAGTAAFSEPEARAIRDLVASIEPVAATFWHSQANAVYASECGAGILSETRAVMTAYATAAGYQAIDVFDAYPVTGDAEGWLASIGVPAITVELSSHASVEFDRNLAGVKALLSRYATK
jgi:hypothetical protein